VIEFAFFLEIIPALLSGLPLTLQLAGASIGIGFVLAMLFALAQQRNYRILVWLIRSFVAIFRGTPLLAQVFLIYYGLALNFRAISALNALETWLTPYRSRA
jgi:octopine/nopaline transport system permease protein